MIDVDQDLRSDIGRSLFSFGKFGLVDECAGTSRDWRSNQCQPEYLLCANKKEKETRTSFFDMLPDSRRRAERNDRTEGSLLLSGIAELVCLFVDATIVRRQQGSLKESRFAP